MKKLMTMIAAVATAFGLYADGINNGTSFEGGTAGKFSEQLSAIIGLTDTAGEEANLWDLTGITTDDGAKIELLGVKYDKPRSLKFKDGEYKDNDYCLTLKTGSNVVTRSIYPVAAEQPYTVASTIWFDSLVKLTAFDQDPEVEGAKLALYLRDKTEDETPAAETNLVLQVGATPIVIGDGSALLDTWARVTIKAVDMNGSKMGFVVFIDKKMVTSTAFAALFDQIAVTKPGALYYKNNDALIPFAGDATIEGVSFQGQGSVDDLVFTTTWADDEGFAEEPAVVMVSLGAGVTAEMVTGVSTDGVTYVAAPTTFASPIPGGKIYWQGGADYCDGSADWTGGNFEIKSTDVKKVVALLNTEKYGDLAEAVADADANGGILKLVEGAAANVLKFTANTIELDLNGQTVNGDDTTPSIQYGSSAQLTIAGTGTVEGKIKKNMGTQCSIAFTLDGAKFKDSNIVNLVAANQIAVKGDDDYYVIKEAVTVSFDLQGYGEGIKAQTIEKGTKATKPDDPVDSTETKEFAGWFAEATCENEFNFDAAVNADTTVYAKWIDLAPTTFTVEVPPAEHTTVLVQTNDIDAATLPGTFTFEAGVEVDVVYTADTGWKITANGSTNIAALAENVVVTAPTVEKDIEPVEPGQDIPADDPAAKADEINKDPALKAQYLKVPKIQGIVEADYRALFEAVPGEGCVKFELTAEAQADIKDDLNDATNEATILNPNEDNKATVTAKIGLWYGIAGDDELTLGSEQVDGDGWVQATSTTITVPVPEIEGGKAFFKPVCSGKNPALTE